MPRTPCRVLASALFLAGATLAVAQSPPVQGFVKMEGKPPVDPSGKLGQIREGKLKVGGTPADLKANQALLRDNARYHVLKATDGKYYLPPETGDLKPRDTASTFDQVLLDITGQMLQPGPETKYSTAQQEYIAEYGAALNEAIREVLKANPPAPIRVNAGRLLALGAKSGAPAFAGTIHELLTDTFPFAKAKDAKDKDGKDTPTKTPPELFLHALTAAGNLFAAYDPVWHLNTDWRSQFRHSFPDKDQITLTRDLLGLLEKGPGVAELAAAGDPDKAVLKPVRPDGAVTVDAPAAGKQATLDSAVPTAEQAAVTAYYRRAVASAVTKIRLDLLGEVGQPPLRPGVAIARIAVGDAKLNPAVTTPEVADAVIGLCYLAPSQNFNIPEALAALAAGGRYLVQAYNIRKTDPVVGRHAQLVPWKLYSARLGAALDHLTRQANQNPRWREHRAAVAQLVGILRDDLVGPFSRDESNTPPSPERLAEFQRGRSGVPAAERSLYTDDPAQTLTPRAPGS